MISGSEGGRGCKWRISDGAWHVDRRVTSITKRLYASGRLGPGPIGGGGRQPVDGPVGGRSGVLTSGASRLHGRTVRRSS